MSLGVIGVVLIAAGAATKWVAAPALVKIPLTVNLTTVADGSSQVYILAKQAVATVPVVATRTVQGDKGAGTGSVAVYDETLCLVAQGTKVDSQGCAASTDPGYIDKTTDRVAFNRKTGLAVAGTKYGAAVNGDAAITHSGLDYTFPIDTKKKTYPLFDAIAGKSFPAVYQGTQTIDGLTAYRFVQSVPASPVTIDNLLPGVYSGGTTVWVEPTTGVILKGAQQIIQTFASGGSTVFDGTLTFTSASVSSQAKFAKSQLAKVRLVRLWLPLGLGVAGLLLVVLALFGGRRRPDAGAPHGRVPQRQPESSQT